MACHKWLKSALTLKTTNHYETSSDVDFLASLNVVDIFIEENERTVSNKYVARAKPNEWNGEWFSVSIRLSSGYLQSKSLEECDLGSTEYWKRNFAYWFYSVLRQILWRPVLLLCLKAEYWSTVRIHIAWNRNWPFLIYRYCGYLL